MRCDGRRADIEGDAIGAVGEAGQDRDDVASLAQRHRHGPAAGAQRLLQAASTARSASAPRRPIARRAPPAGGGSRWTDRACPARAPRHSAGARPDRCRSDASRRACARPAGGPGSPAGTSTTRSPQNFRLTAEPPAGRERAALVDIALLDRVPGACVIRRRVDRVLGEMALGHVDLAASADAAPAADGIRDRRRACALRRADSSPRQTRRACPTA